MLFALGICRSSDLGKVHVGLPLQFKAAWVLYREAKEFGCHRVYTTVLLKSCDSR